MRNRMKYNSVLLLGAVLLAFLALAGSIRLRGLDAERHTRIEPNSPQASQAGAMAEVGVTPGDSVTGAVEIANTQYRMNVVVGGSIELVTVKPADETTHPPTRESKD